MTTEEKARRVFDAADRLAEGYRSEGDNARADLVLASFATLPRDSAARLHDILQAQR